MYPDLSSEGEELQEYIATDLLETSHKRALERSGKSYQPNIPTFPSHTAPDLECYSNIDQSKVHHGISLLFLFLLLMRYL